MLRDEVDWLSGEVEFWDLDGVDVASDVAQQRLKEDLAQVAYPNGIVLDIGWYCDGREEEEGTGAFGVIVAMGGEWQKPLFDARVRPDQLVATIHRAVALADSTARNSPRG